jgi:Rrf2 family protein
MARCLNLTRAGEYAIAALARLALLSDGSEAVTVEELAAAQAIPAPFLAKILQQCSRAGLVRTRKGAAGGVALARAPEDVALLSIIEACEGSYARDRCVFYSARRCAGPDCAVYCPLRTEEERLRERLRAVTLAEMVLSLNAHPDAGAGKVLVGGDPWTRR